MHNLICLQCDTPLVLEWSTAVVAVEPSSQSVIASSETSDPTHVPSVYSPPLVVIS